MKLYIRRIVFLIIIVIPFNIVAQEASSKQAAPTSSRAHRKAAKQKWKEQRQLERDQKKEVKEYHKKLQTKQTVKRMKKEKKKSDKLRRNKRDFFLIRWFKHS